MGMGKDRGQFDLDAIKLAGLSFGQGLPKICIPLMGETSAALLCEAGEAASLPADLFEWRLDGFFTGSVSQSLEGLKRELGGKPLLCTLRTRREGGAADLSPESYEIFLSALLDQGGFELLDIELSCGEGRVRRLVEKARKAGIGTVVSRHDFEKTPPEGEMLDTLKAMKALGADLPKLAVMPQSPHDVLALLSVTLRAREEIGPVITMSMGELGKLSRVSGALTGSCMTFGAAARASAPGQMNAEDLQAILEDLSPFCEEGEKQ